MRLVELGLERLHELFRLGLGGALLLLTHGDEARVHLVIVQRGVVLFPRLGKLFKRSLAEIELRHAERDVSRGFRRIRERCLGESRAHLVTDGFRLTLLIDEPDESRHDSLERLRRDVLVRG